MRGFAVPAPTGIDHPHTPLRALKHCCKTCLSRTQVKRIVKAKLAQLEDHAADGSKKEFQLNKACLLGFGLRLHLKAHSHPLQRLSDHARAQDALLAFAESAKVFINYITAAANDACKEAKRQTMNQTDVLTALEELQFGELIPGVKESLEGATLSRFQYCAQARCY